MKREQLVLALWRAERAYDAVPPDGVKVLVAGNARALIFEDGETLGIAIAGTDDVRDWFDNISTHKVPWTPRGRVHEGFADHWRRIGHQLRQIVDIDRFTEIHLCGHSLGGAVAVVGAADAMMEWTDRIASVVTFGAPRVGDAAFSTAITKAVGSITRVVHANDPVTWLPALMSGFRHVGRTLQLGNPVRCAHIADHRINRYRAAVQAIGAGEP